jgi:ubiquinone/menaquinone biosynthesis C-methylase UbiE/dienelactone hydrolase
MSPALCQNPNSDSVTISDLAAIQQMQIASELVSYASRNGRRVTAYLDRAVVQRNSPQLVILAPKYGETKKNNLQLAYFLASNGFTVLRFDLTFHVGESEGEMSAFTLPGMVDDILGSIDFLLAGSTTEKIVLVASSLSARCALRAAALDLRVGRFVSIVGVVNMQKTLSEVYREDIFGTFINGRHWGMTDIIGFDINGETFLSTAVEHRLHDLDGSIQDAAKLRIPSAVFYAEEDLWVNPSEVRQVFAASDDCQLVSIKGAMHEIRENPKAAEETFKMVVSACLGAEKNLTLAQPDKQCIFRQNKIERDRLRQTRPKEETEKIFWSTYLSKYSLLEKAEDYQAYLDTVGSLLGIFHPGETVLDAGCGNGMVGMWILRDVMRRAMPDDSSMPCAYVGVDLTDQGLIDAMRKHDETRRRFGAATQTGEDMGFVYSSFDFDWLAKEAGEEPARLPFQDGTFDKICCSLVLSYLVQPETLLGELRRVLKPGGVMVVSSMKPYCDMSAIYRGFVDQQGTESDVEKARNLLRAAGTIKLKEEKGQYAFFSENELADMAGRVGLKPGSVRRSLGDQANVIRVTK